MQPRHEGQRGSISHYDLLEKVGQGGMGVVYRAHDLKLDRIVALKFLYDCSLDSPLARSRFIQEARSISRLNHRHIAVIHTIEECEGEIFMVFEYLSGGTLRSRLEELSARHERLGPQQVAGYGIQISEALAHAHASGIIHRDVKPGNTMFASNGDLKIVDFGVSKLRGGDPITEVGTVVGTPQYMSPEQARGDNLDARSDIFSVGVVLYEMALGRAPFASDRPEGVIHQILYEPVQRVAKSVPDFPPRLDNVIARALEKKPGDRYQRIVDLASDLRSFLGGSASGSDAIPTEIMTGRVQGLAIESATSIERVSQRRVSSILARLSPLYISLTLGFSILAVGLFVALRLNSREHAAKAPPAPSAKTTLLEEPPLQPHRSDPPVVSIGPAAPDKVKSLSEVIPGDLGADSYKAEIEKTLLSRYQLTKTTYDKMDIVTPGAVLVLQRDKLVMVTADSAANPCMNKYYDGRITQNSGCNTKDKLGRSLPSAGNAPTTRTFVAGEKFWVTRIEVRDSRVIFEFLTDLFKDVRYEGSLMIPFMGLPADTFFKLVSEVITVAPST